TITPGAASRLTSQITANPTTVSADIGTSVITVQLKDAYSHNITPVNYTHPLTTTNGSIASTPTDNHNGTYTATLTDHTTRTDTITGTDTPALHDALPILTITPGAASRLTSQITANPTTVSADIGTSVITVQLKDA